MESSQNEVKSLKSFEDSVELFEILEILQDLLSSIFLNIFCYDVAFGLDVPLLQQDGPSWAAHTLESTTVQPGVLTV